MMSLPLTDDSWLLVLTGAGVSAESGLPTFRGQGGLWRSLPFEQLASPGAFRDNPALVWEFYSERRKGAEQVAPNPGHLALAQVERRLGDRFLLVTQNVDGLHRRAGSQRVIELHGNLLRSRCSHCDRPPFEDARVYPAGFVPRCDACGAPVRPDVVWFGEAIDSNALSRVFAFLEDARSHELFFLAAGTSGVVYPAAGLVDEARQAGAMTYLVNAEAADNGGRFEHVLTGRSGELLPRILGTSTRSRLGTAAFD